MSGAQRSCAVACPAQQTQTGPALPPTDPIPDRGELSNEFGRAERAMVGLSSLLLSGDTSPSSVHCLQIQWLKGQAPLPRDTLLLNKIFVQHLVSQSVSKGRLCPSQTAAPTSLHSPACSVVSA